MTLWAAILGLLSGFLAVLAAVLSWRSSRAKDALEQAERKLAERNARVSELEKYIGSSIFTEKHIDYNVVLLGPKTSGKTSFATTWAASWKTIRDIKPTPNYVRHEFVFPDYRIRSRGDSACGIAHDVHEHARVVIWDYGGEDHLRDKAFRELAGLNRCILCMVLTAEDSQRRKNDEYFSLGFLHGLREAIAPRSVLPMALVLFNKFDLAGGSKTLEDLMNDNDRSLENIRALFGRSAQCHVVSAQTGHGILDVLRSVGAVMVDASGHPRDQ
jgi:hypothetical protein